MRVTMWMLDDDEDEEVDEQTEVGSFVLEGGKVVIDSADPENLDRLKEILSERLVVHNSDDELVGATQDPELWMRELPYTYNGIRLRAEVVEDDDAEQEQEEEPA